MIEVDGQEIPSAILESGTEKLQWKKSEIGELWIENLEIPFSLADFLVFSDPSGYGYDELPSFYPSDAIVLLMAYKIYAIDEIAIIAYTQHNKQTTPHIKLRWDCYLPRESNNMNENIMNFLHWGVSRFTKIKKVLIQMNWIEEKDIRHKNGRMAGKQIVVTF